MDTETRSVTGDDLDRYDWRSVVETSSRRSCWDYSRIYYEHARAAEAKGDGSAQVLDLFGLVTSLTLRFDVRNEQFAPVSILDRLSDSVVALLAARADTVEDPELRARIEDLAWVRARNHQLGRQAVADYLASAHTLSETGDWGSAEQRIERALRLASELRGKAQIATVVAYIEGTLSNYDPSHEWKFLAAHLMELLLEVGLGDAEWLSALAERVAIYSEEERRWDRAEKHWRLKAQWDERRGETEAARQARIRAAETYVAAAEEALVGEPGYLLASNELLRAVEALRRLGEREEAEDLRQRALGYQEQARAQAQRFSVDFDFTDVARAARRAVAGKSLRDALLTLASMGRPSSLEELRSQTEEVIELAPVQHLISAVQADDRGRITARRPPHGSGDENQEAVAMDASMLANAETNRGGHVCAFVEPARQRILLEHRPRLRDLLDLVTDSPFVPEGREAIFAEGLHAGLVGDFLIAGHLLPPQIENSTRYLLDQRGLPTSSLSSDGIQEDFDLNVLFGNRRRHEVVTVFGEDLTFDLCGLLVERWGANLRNRMSHGLMDSASFSSIQVAYLWWITLRLCCWHLLVMAEPDMASQASDEDESRADHGDEGGDQAFDGASSNPSSPPAQT